MHKEPCMKRFCLSFLLNFKDAMMLNDFLNSDLRMRVYRNRIAIEICDIALQFS